MERFLRHSGVNANIFWIESSSGIATLTSVIEDDMAAAQDEDQKALQVLDEVSRQQAQAEINTLGIRSGDFYDRNLMIEGLALSRP